MFFEEEGTQGSAVGFGAKKQDYDDNLIETPAIGAPFASFLSGLIKCSGHWKASISIPSTFAGSAAVWTPHRNEILTNRWLDKPQKPYVFNDK